MSFVHLFFCKDVVGCESTVWHGVTGLSQGWSESKMVGSGGGTGKGRPILSLAGYRYCPFPVKLQTEGNETGECVMTTVPSVGGGCAEM